MVIVIGAQEVLIVPLWNWNICPNVVATKGLTGSNRTFMELKYKKLVSSSVFDGEF